MSTDESSRQITTEEATIKTATVEIKTLTLSGKQMTLAVFRQLSEEKVIDSKTGDLRGLPWGRINYHSGVGCDDFKDGAHVHVVWQKGHELRRSCVRPFDKLSTAANILRRFDAQQRWIAERWAAAASLDGWKPEHAQEYHSYGSMNTFQLALPDGSHQVSVRVTEDLVTLWDTDDGGKEADNSQVPSTPRNEYVAQVLEEIALARRHLRTLAESQPQAFWLAASQRLVSDFEAYKHRYEETYRRLTMLDQLFIAV